MAKGHKSQPAAADQPVAEHHDTGVPDTASGRQQRLEMILRGTVGIDQYRKGNGDTFSHPGGTFGSTSVQVLPELTGLPLCDAVFSLVAGLRPTSIRVYRETICTDAWPERVTIQVDEHDRVVKITQEVDCLYGRGAEVQEVIAKLREEADESP